MPFSADLSLLGALTAVAITMVLAFVPFSAERRWLHHAWLTAWAVMSAHFSLQVLQRADVGMPLSGWAADGLLVLAVLLFTDWPWRALGAGGRGAGQARRGWTWPGRAFAVGLAGWVWLFPNSHVLAQTIAFGVLPVAGGVAALRLKMGGRLTRWVLGLGLIVWGLGFMTAPLPWGNVQNGALVDLLTLICKSFCGMAMILFAADEQRELAEAGRDYFNDLYQNSPMWYHTVDRDGQVTDLNQVAMDVLGLDRGDIIGHRIRDLPQVVSPDAMPPVDELMAGLEQEGAIPNFELRVRVSNGLVRSFRSYVRAIRDAAGRFQGARAMLCDITAERELQGQLLTAQKMQAVGTLTAGVAHDFNNLLSTVLGQVELIEAKHGPQLPRDAADRITAIGTAGRRGAELVAQLLAFSRGREVATEPLSLPAVVESAAEMLRHGLPETVAVTVRLDGRQQPPLTVQGNLTQLQQVLLNLGVNAGQAMPQGGQLTLALDGKRNVVRAGAPAEAAARDWAVLTVADSGEGIAPDVRQRLFEPFFTTKAPGKGSGLGLAVAYGIVEAHGGFITVDSAPGEGARFEIYLPILASGSAVGGAAGLAMGGASGSDRQRSGGSDWSFGGAAGAGAYSVGGRRAGSGGNYRGDAEASRP